MEKNIYFDRLRIIAMFLVIGVHSVGSIEKYASGSIQETVVRMLSSLNALGVPFFFSLSGVLILSKEYDNIRNFYKKRLIRIGVPYLVYALIYVCYFTGYEENNILGIPLEYLKDIITSDVHPTHWFVYSILGLYFASPFLSVMVHALNDYELTVLTAGSFSVIVLCRIFNLFNLNFGVNNVVFNIGNLWLFIAGYSVRRIVKNRNIRFIIQHHLTISFILIVLYLISNEMVFGQMAIFLMLIDNNKKKINPTRMDNIINNISKHSYSVYLIHAAVISLILMIYDNWGGSLYIVKCILLYPVVFLVSYFLVITIDFLVTDRLIRMIVAHRCR